MTAPSALRRFLVAAALAAAALWTSAGPAAAQDAPKPPELPAGVVARVFGEDVTEVQLLDRLARRYERHEKGRQILDQIVDDEIVSAEARRRGVTVTDEETLAYAEKLAEVVKAQTGGRQQLDDVLRETGTTRAEFLRTAKEYLVREKMAREDLGTKPGEELPDHRLRLWTTSLRRKAEPRFEGLGEGVLAQVGEVAIDRVRFARELRTRLPVEMVAAVRAEIVLDVATRHAVEKAGVTVTDEDVSAQIEKFRRRFEESPQVRGTGVAFEQFLQQTFGIGEAELREDATFRARVALERMLSRDISEERVRAHWEENRAAYGDRALVRQVFIAAGEADPRFERRLPTFAEANELALRAKVAILEQAGLLRGKESGDRSLGDVVTAVAKEFEPDEEGRAKAGEPTAWTRQSVAGEAALEKAVFDGETGRVVGPVRSASGCHVLLVEERRPAPAFDEVAPVVREDLLRLAVRNFQFRLKVDDDVVLAELK